MEARTLRPFETTRQGSSSTLETPAPAETFVHATWFPPTVRARPDSPPLVLVEPILFRRDLLTRPGGLVPWLEAEGFSVWVVGPDAPDRTDARSFGAGIVRAVDVVAQKSGSSRVSIVAASFGAPAALHALEVLTAPTAKIAIDRVVFLGGALDHAYPGSVAARIAAQRGGPGAALCTLDDGAFCAHAFHDARAATPWLGSVPRAEEAEAAPAATRFPALSRFHDLPVLFVAGKGDGLAPSESIFPAYTAWGRGGGTDRDVPKLFFLAGRENGFEEDYDAYELLAGEHAEGEVWTRLAEWLRP
jgi:hypothetical protein